MQGIGHCLGPISTRVLSHAVWNSRVEPVVHDSRVEPVVHDSRVEPVVHDSRVEPVVPDSRVEPVVHDSRVEPVVHDSRVEPVVHDSRVEPVVPDLSGVGIQRRIKLPKQCLTSSARNKTVLEQHMKHLQLPHLLST